MPTLVLTDEEAQLVLCLRLCTLDERAAVVRVVAAFLEDVPPEGAPAVATRIDLRRGDPDPGGSYVVANC
jgi:hypothetical protein